jgi:hypothetical protein
MYCPKCAAPIDGLKFCRACGTNVSLVSQAITDRSPKQIASDEDDQSRKPASLDKGIKKVSEGVGMLVVAALLLYSFPGWGVWMLFWMIPSAFLLLGPGIGEIVRAKQERRLTTSPNPVTPMEPTSDPNKLPESNSVQAIPPSSVTEDATRRLEN